MRKVEEKSYGDEIIDAGDIFCDYGIGRHLCKKACDKCRRLCIGRKIGRPMAYGICVWNVIFLRSCIRRICRTVWMEIWSRIYMDRSWESIIGSLLAWVVLGRRTKVMTQHLNSKTMPDFFGERYESKALKITASAIVFIFLVPYTASVYNGLSRLFGMA